MNLSKNKLQVMKHLKTRELVKFPPVEINGRLMLEEARALLIKEINSICSKSLKVMRIKVGIAGYRFH